MLPFVLGVPVLVLPVIAAPARPGARTLGLVATSYFFLALCLTSVLWGNTVADVSTLLDTAYWLVLRRSLPHGLGDALLRCRRGALRSPLMMNAS